MARGTEEYRICEYNEWIIWTNGTEFYAKDNGGNQTASAKTLEALKKTLLAPTKVDVKAIILNDGARYSSWKDKQKAEHSVVQIYGVSGAGALLFTRANGRKDKTTRYNNELRLWDESKIAEYDRIVEAMADLEKQKETLMETWETLYAEEVRRMAKT